MLVQLLGLSLAAQETQTPAPSIPGSKVVLKGHVLADDGLKPSGTIYMRGWSNTNPLVTDLSWEAAASGEFSENRFPPGVIRVTVWGAGFAPTNVELGNIKSDLSNIQIRLNRGFSFKVKVIDWQRKPISGAEVSIQYRLEPAPPRVKQVTDGKGIAIIPEMAAGKPFEISADANGFQKRSWELLQVSDGSVVLYLKPSVTTEYIVSDAKTGQPIQGATVEMKNLKDQLTLFHPLTGQTDAAGCLRLDSLDEEGKYQGTVTAPGYAVLGLGTVTPGETRELQLQPAAARVLRIRGIPPEKLDSAGKIKLRCGISFGSKAGTSYSASTTFESFEAVASDGVATFQVPRHDTADMKFYLGDRRMHIPAEIWAVLPEEISVDFDSMKPTPTQPTAGERSR